MSLISDAIAASGGTTSAKFEDVGDVHEGKIISVDIRQRTKFGTTELAWWDKEETRPQEQVLVTIQTDERDDEIEDDDGSRTVYIKKWGSQWQAFKNAAKNGTPKGEDPDVKVGGHFKAEFTGYGKAEKGMQKPKLFEYTYTAPSSKVAKAVAEASDDDEDEPSLEDQIKSFIGMGWSDSKIKKALPGAKASVIAAIRDAEDD